MTKIFDNVLDQLQKLGATKKEQLVSYEVVIPKAVFSTTEFKYWVSKRASEKKLVYSSTGLPQNLDMFGMPVVWSSSFRDIMVRRVLGIKQMPKMLIQPKIKEPVKIKPSMDEPSN